MADSKRLTILKALTNHLAADVSIANGYNVDLAGAVWRGRASFSIDEPVPRVTIIEALNPDREMKPAGGKEAQKDGWILLILGHAEDDRDNPTDPAHQLMADIKKSLGKIALRTEPAYMLGHLIADIDIEPGTVRPPDEQSALAYFHLRVRLTVVERLFDPYRLN